MLPGTALVRLEVATKLDGSVDVATQRQELEHLVAMLTNLVRRCETRRARGKRACTRARRRSRARARARAKSLKRAPGVIRTASAWSERGPRADLSDLGGRGARRH